MKYTLLDLVQIVLSSVDGDEINSIADSVESRQAVVIIRTVYEEILSRAGLGEHSGLFSLDPSLDGAKPTLMYLPDTARKAEWVKYNKETAGGTDMSFQAVTYLSLDDFLKRMYNIKESDDNVGSFTHTAGTSDINFLYYDNAAPTYYTSFDDRTLIFDSYDAAVDTTLQSAKTLCFGELVIPWTESDTFVPALDENQFPLLVNEAKALAWAEMKQTQHTKAEVNAKRGWVTVQNRKFRTERPSPLDTLPNYGRK